MFDLLIRGGEVVTPQGVGKWSIAINGQQIVSVGIDDPGAQAARIVDATGQIVVPGGIEPHAHLARKFAGLHVRVHHGHRQSVRRCHL